LKDIRKNLKTAKEKLIQTNFLPVQATNILIKPVLFPGKLKQVNFCKCDVGKD
jgi:hypothetical protein